MPPRALENSVKARRAARPASAPQKETRAPHIIKGRGGEDAAAKYLSSLGLEIMARNARVGHCEIDIIAKDGDELAFVEVRTRGDGWMMTAQDSVGPRKIANLIRAGRLWTEEKNFNGFWRIDLVAVTLEEGKEPSIEYIKNITEPIS